MQECLQLQWSKHQTASNFSKRRFQNFSPFSRNVAFKKILPFLVTSLSKFSPFLILCGFRNFSRFELQSIDTVSFLLLLFWSFSSFLLDLVSLPFKFNVQGGRKIFMPMFPFSCRIHVSESRISAPLFIAPC